MGHRIELTAQQIRQALRALLGALVPVAFLLTGCVSSHADCAWGTSVTTWVDENENGRQDPGELPLEGIHITVNDTMNNYRDVGERAVTNWEGTVRIDVWLPGCPNARFEVVADPPAGYRSTTDRVVAIQGEGYGDRTSLMFGFARLPGVPSPTPYVAGLSCVTEARSAYDLATAPDGALWTAMSDGVARYDSVTETWQTYPVSMTILLSSFTHLQIGADGTVWLDTSDGAARLQHGTWMTFLDRESLVGASVASIGTGRDGRIWFITPYGPEDLVVFDPATNTWQGMIANTNFHVESVRLFTDGSVWRATFDTFASASAPSPVPAGWTIYDQHTFSPGELHELPDRVRGFDAAALDTQNRLWFTHSFGVSSLDLSTDAWTSYDRSAPEAIQGEQRPDIAVGADGVVWLGVGSEYPRAFRLEPEIERWRGYDPRDGIPNSNQIEHVAVDGDGRVWFGFGHYNVLARCTPTQ